MNRTEKLQRWFLILFAFSAAQSWYHNMNDVVQNNAPHYMAASLPSPHRLTEMSLIQLSNIEI